MAAFATVSLSLAAIGLYGVLAYAVRQRTREIGIRVALGATAAHIRGAVLRQAGAALGAGLIAGIAGALLLGRWLTSLAFGTSPANARIIAAAGLVLAITGLLAAWLPARRAVRVSPAVAVQEPW
jgi:ABC-type antimicrobial peptide transport system permease subunit